MIEIQHWADHHWFTVETGIDEETAVARATEMAKVEHVQDVRVAVDGKSIARWLFGDRTIR